jgi:hypothetical protein
MLSKIKFLIFSLAILSIFSGCGGSGGSNPETNSTVEDDDLPPSIPSEYLDNEKDDIDTVPEAPSEIVGDTPLPDFPKE